MSDDDSYDPATCPHCEGEATLLSNLGNWTWLRGAAAAHQPTAANPLCGSSG